MRWEVQHDPVPGAKFGVGEPVSFAVWVTDMHGYAGESPPAYLVRKPGIVVEVHHFQNGFSYDVRSAETGEIRCYRDYELLRA